MSEQNESSFGFDAWSRTDSSRFTRLAWRMFSKMAPRKSRQTRLLVTVPLLWLSALAAKGRPEKLRGHDSIQFEIDRFMSRQSDALSREDEVYIQICEVMRLQVLSQTAHPEEYGTIVLNSASAVGGVKLRDLGSEAQGVTRIFFPTVVFSVIQVAGLHLSRRSLSEIKKIVRVVDDNELSGNISSKVRTDPIDAGGGALVRLFCYLAVADIESESNSIEYLKKAMKQCLALNESLKDIPFLNKRDTVRAFRLIVASIHFRILISIYVKNESSAERTFLNSFQECFDQYRDILDSKVSIQRYPDLSKEINRLILLGRLAGNDFDNVADHRVQFRSELRDFYKNEPREMSLKDFWSIDADIGFLIKISRIANEIDECMPIIEMHISLGWLVFANQVDWRAREKLASRLIYYASYCSNRYLKSRLVDDFFRVRKDMDRRSRLADIPAIPQVVNVSSQYASWATLNSRLVGLADAINQHIPFARLGEISDEYGKLSFGARATSSHVGSIQTGTDTLWAQRAKEKSALQGVDGGVIVTVSSEGTSAFIINASGSGSARNRGVWAANLTEEAWLEALATFQQRVEYDDRSGTMFPTAETEDNVLEAVKDHSEFLWNNLMKHVDFALRKVGLAEGSKIRIFSPGFINLLPIHCASSMNKLGRKKYFFENWISSYSTFNYNIDRRFNSNPSKLFIMNGDVSNSHEIPIDTSGWPKVDEFQPSRSCDPSSITERLNDADYAILYSHGVIDDDNPLATGLAICGGHRFTVADLVGAKFKRAPRILLASCKLGMSGSNGHLGPSDGFVRQLLTSGASTVISSTLPLSINFGARVSAVLGNFENGMSTSDIIRLHQIQRKLSADKSVWDDLPENDRICWMSLMCSE